MKTWQSDLLWTLCFRGWTCLFQIMHMQRYPPSSPAVSLQFLSHLTQNMHMAFECQVSCMSKTNGSGESPRNNQHVSKESDLYSVLRPSIGMEKANRIYIYTHTCIYAHTQILFHSLSNFKNEKIIQPFAWTYTVCPKRKQLIFSKWIKDHEHLCFLLSTLTVGSKRHLS